MSISMTNRIGFGNFLSPTKCSRQFSCISITALLLALTLFPVRGMALGQPSYLVTTPALNSFRLVHQGVAAKLYVDLDD